MSLSGFGVTTEHRVGVCGLPTSIYIRGAVAFQQSTIAAAVVGSLPTWQNRRIRIPFLTWSSDEEDMGHGKVNNNNI